jgi:hypothetical protein
MSSRLAIKGFNLLTNGMGGMDWAGLPVVVELLGIDDVEQFLWNILTIRSDPGDEDDDQPEGNDG